MALGGFNLHHQSTTELSGSAATKVVPGQDKPDFFWTSTPTPHIFRRRAILQQHPEVRELMKPDIWQAPYVILVVVLNLVVAWKVGQTDPSWATLLFVSYVTSGTFNNICFIAMHEVMHCLIFQSVLPHYLIALCTNVSMGVPAAAGFFHYHSLHHTEAGVEGVDTDIATALEGELVGTSVLRKIIYILCLPLTYSFRPFVLTRKPVRVFDVLNVILILLTNGLVWWFWGFKSLFYLVGGAVLGMALHPFNGHFIGEHFVLEDREEMTQDTYSCYDVCNPIMLNVGYHVEHHDFPNIPGSRLPDLRRIAKSYYDNLAHYSSWPRCTLSFITNKRCSPVSRVQRLNQAGAPIVEPHKSFHGSKDWPSSPFYVKELLPAVKLSLSQVGANQQLRDKENIS